MNPLSIVSIGSAGLAFALSLALLITGIGTRDLQTKWQDQQQELMNQQQEFATKQQAAQQQQQQIQSGKYFAEQVGPAVLKDLAGIVVTKKNEKIRGLLARYGVSVQENPPAGATPSGAAPASSTPTASSATPSSSSTRPDPGFRTPRPQ